MCWQCMCHAATSCPTSQCPLIHVQEDECSQPDPPSTQSADRRVGGGGGGEGGDGENGHVHVVHACPSTAAATCSLKTTDDTPETATDTRAGAGLTDVPETTSAADAATEATSKSDATTIDEPSTVQPATPKAADAATIDEPLTVQPATQATPKATEAATIDEPSTVQPDTQATPNAAGASTLAEPSTAQPATEATPKAAEAEAATLDEPSTVQPSGNNAPTTDNDTASASASMPARRTGVTSSPTSSSTRPAQRSRSKRKGQNTEPKWSFATAEGISKLFNVSRAGTSAPETSTSTSTHEHTSVTSATNAGVGPGVTATAPASHQRAPSGSKATLAERAIVNNLGEMFDFWDYSLDVLVDGMDEEESTNTLEQLAHALEEDSLSTSFSGVRAPETALAVLRYRLGALLGRQITCGHANMSHMIEWQVESQAECLVAAKHEGGCVFGDIADFFRAELKQSVIPELLQKPAMALDVLMPLLQSNRLVQTSARCLAHGRVCCLKTCNRHIAGTSCRPFSRRGVALGTHDPEVIYLMAWLALRMTLQEPDITQENVVGFPPHVIEQAVSSLYYIEVCDLDAVQFGCACARKRQFIRLRHKQKIVALISPLSRFAVRFHRAVNFHWSMRLVVIIMFGAQQHT